MFELFTIFMLIYMLCKAHSVNIIKHMHDGYYLYYEVKQFSQRYREFTVKVKRIRLWNTKSSDEEPPIF
jgi:hypothetical protein